MKNGGNGGAQFDVLANLDEDLDVDSSPVISGLEGNKRVVEGEDKESTTTKGKRLWAFNNRLHTETEKEAIDRNHHRQFVVKGMGKEVDFNQGILKEISRNTTQSRPSPLDCDQPDLALVQ